MADREHRQAELIARLRRDAVAREEELADLRERLAAAEDEIEDLRAIQDALAPAEFPQRPGLELAAAFLHAVERVSGDFYLAAEGPRDATVLVVGDVVGHGPTAAKRAAFVRTAFAATAPFSYEPGRLLSWANTALIERAGITPQFVTTACVTYLPDVQRLRWAYAGHPPALWLDDGRELIAPQQGAALGISGDPDYVEGSRRCAPGSGVLMYADGVTEARSDGERLGVDAVSAALARLQNPSPDDAVAALSAQAAEFADGELTDDVCLLAARMT
jgi:phosphoserine phosphatase RsbU/P